MIYLKSSLGVEIRQADLVISCLQRNLSNSVFTHFKRIPDYLLRDRNEVRKEIDSFFKSHRIGRDNIVLGVPRSDIVLRYLDLPVEVADNLKQVMLYQVQSFEPTEEEKFYFDYGRLRSELNGKRLQVLLLMIRRSTLDEHLKVLRELGIRPTQVTASSVGLSNLLVQNRKEFERKTFVLADITPVGIELLAVHDGNLVYSRESHRVEGLGWKELLLKEVEEAVGKVRLGPDETVEKIVLAGDVSDEMQQEIGPGSEDWQLMAERIGLEIGGVDLKRHLMEGASSLGLAYSGLERKPALKLNLLPQELRIHQTRWAYVPAILFGLAVLVLLAGLAFREIVQDRILSAKLDREIQSLKPRVDKVQAIRAQAQGLEKRINFVEGLLRKRDLNLEVLQELTTILPPDTFLTMYQNDQGTIQTSGSSASAPDLIPKLEKSQLLKDVVQRGTIFKDAQTGKDRFTFEMKLERVP